jgi:hypothetical protein
MRLRFWDLWFIIASDWRYPSNRRTRIFTREAALPLFDLLHFGTGTQAAHYFTFCLVAILGTLQAVAARYQRRDLMWLEGPAGYLLSALCIGGGFAWFFLTDDEIFAPGLAGGELFAVFAAAFFAAVIFTRMLAFGLNRMRSLAPAPRTQREKEPLT